MTNKFLALILIFITTGLTAAPGKPNGRKPDGDKTIMVSGIGIVPIKPNAAIFNIGIDTESKQVRDAQMQNTIKMEEIKKLLEPYNIPKNRLKTINFSINPQYEYTGKKSVWKGYQINNTLSIQVDELDKLPEIIDTLSDHVTYVRGIQFIHTDIDKFQNQAISQAISNAKQKANFIAKATGLTVKSIQKIDENSLGKRGPIPFADTRALSTAVGPYIEEGTIDIHANVRILFNIG